MFLRSRLGRRASMAVTASLLLAVTACGGDDGASVPLVAADSSFDELVAAAEEEGTVVFYGGQSEAALQKIQQAFQAKYDIEVQYQRLASGPQRERIGQEFESGRVSFDVSQLSDEAWVQDTADNWATLDPERIPELQKVPEDFQRDSYAVSSIVPFPLIYNTEKIAAEDVPQNSDELLDPKWRGRFAIVNPDTGLSIRTGYYTWLQKYGEEGFAEFMSKLFALKPRVVDSGSNGTQQVGAGELDFVLFASASFATAAKAEGAPVETLYQAPTGATLRSLQVAKEAPHPNAGQLFLNFLMSPEGLEILNGDGQAAAPYPVEGGTGLELPETVEVPDPTDVAKSSDRILETFRSVSG
jgi:iron(III) transport system substrate-binding protein